MLIVEVKSNIDKAIKELKKKVYKTKQTIELYSRKEYLKPSVKKNKQLKKAKYIQKKRQS